MSLFGRRRRNPFRVAGINFKTAGWLFGGIVGTALANDRVIFPLVNAHLSGLVGAMGSVQQRVANGISTTATAILGGALLHEFDPEGVETAALGGATLGLGRIALAPVGGDLNVTVPGFTQTLAPQLAAGNAATSAATGNPPAIGAPQATVSPSSYL